MRPAFEDFVGAGAVIASIAGTRRTPEAETAAAAYLDARDDLEQRLSECVSGRELAERGYDIDVTWAAAVDVSHTVPVLVDGKYVSAPPPSPAATSAPSRRP
ncbi:2-phosphosulfolactate phosphatase [Candidatus Poriferisodalis sp.]|uniref:2-phosphosulfolactate phosphatase n=1 Tax=Candidatus Poriferisodalis sp. TaxID=3101277 RepID=UPI003B5B036C